MAGFGESLVTTGPISGEVVYIGRGCDPAYQAGQPLDPYLANPAGKIAIIDRGTCEFRKGQEGAGPARSCVIVANNIAGSPIAMGGADPTITIPSVMVSQDDGSAVQGQRAARRDHRRRHRRRAGPRFGSRRRRHRARIRPRHLEPSDRRAGHRQLPRSNVGADGRGLERLVRAHADHASVRHGRRRRAASAPT